jgi:peptidyl-prolyl cis-trans isomerase B (cyclophilin B)
MWRLFLKAVLLMCCAYAAAFAQEAKPTATPTSKSEVTVAAPKKNNARPPEMQAPVEKMAAQCVTLETEAGVIELELLAEAAPETVRNFLNLAATGAFDTTTFSRVVKDFVIQGGNLSTHQKPTSALAERARRTIPDEPNEIKHERGILSMARPETPNGATTNFFILVGDAPHLDGKFAAFGRVKRGMEVVDAINKAPADGEKPDKPVRITRVIVAACAVK